MKSSVSSLSVVLALLAACPAHACIPVQEDPKEDALRTDAVFYGVVVSERTLPGNGPMRDLVLTVKGTKALKGLAPSSAEINWGCGDYYAKRNERVIIVRTGQQYRIHQASGKYERLLLTALRSGR